MAISLFKLASRSKQYKAAKAAAKKADARKKAAWKKAIVQAKKKTKTKKR